MAQGTVSILKEIMQELKLWRTDGTVPRRQRLAEAARNDAEVLDHTPVEIPVGYNDPPTMEEMIQRYVRTTMSDYAREHQLGTFEEEDDFELEDPFALPMGQYDVNEFDLSPDEEMPPSAPVEDPPQAPQEPSEATLGSADPPEAGSSENPGTASQ